jgi:hypothetical protein
MPDAETIWNDAAIRLRDPHRDPAAHCMREGMRER